MKYECPSCKLTWEDELQPIEQISNPLCIFCSSKHTEKELLNWQMDHLENISKKHFILVIRRFYRYVENEIKICQERIYDCKRENGGGDSP